MANKITRHHFSFCFLLVLLLPGCGDPDNTKYKPADSAKLGFGCYLKGLLARKQQFDQGVMTPLDAKFSKMICMIKNEGDNWSSKDFPTIHTIISDGVVKTQVGDMYISLHGRSNSGLFDGVMSSSVYEPIGMHQQFYMTDYQAYQIKKFMEEDSYELVMKKAPDKITSEKRDDDATSDSSGHTGNLADIGLIQNIIYGSVKARINNKNNPIADLPNDASLALHSLKAFGYKKGDTISKDTLYAFIIAHDFANKCIKENWVNDELKITQSDDAIATFNKMFADVDLKVFDKIK